jgi:AraC-like DNA-binding protein/ABC-type sugar transport system substrate-binding protein
MGVSASASDPLRPAWPVPSPETDFVPIGSWNTDGLIVVNPLHVPARSRDMQTLITAGHPVLFVGAGEQGPTIAADNASGVLDAIDHLVTHGHRRIAFIAGSPEDVDGDSGDRLRAYQTALQTYGIVADSRLVAYGRHVYATGYTAMGEILDGGAPFTAVLASNDESALGAMQALTESGRRIPQDVAVIGFDDRPESAVHTPALSSVRIPLFRMGYRAVELLAQIIAGNTAPAEPVRIPTRLVPRASCGCGRNHRCADLPNLTVRPEVVPDQEAWRAAAVQPMTAAVFAETQGVVEAEVEACCRRLVDALAAVIAQRDPAVFYEALDTILEDGAFEQEDAYAWQAAIRVLQQASGPHVPSPELFDRARVAISEYMQRQHRQFVVNQQRNLHRLGVLTAQLSMALDETQVFTILARHVPAIGIGRAWVALFDCGNTTGELTRCRLHSITTPEQPVVHCRSRDFPSSGLPLSSEPFSLALLPLLSPRGQLGFVAFESDHIELYGAIVQQLAAALHAAQLYREAMEGRRLAREADRFMIRMLSTASHQLPTPLDRMFGLSGICAQDGDRFAGPGPQTYRDECPRRPGRRAQRLVQYAMAYVHEHYAEPISRQDLARHVNLAEDYLTNCFHKEVGMTPITYLNRYRVNQAKSLLMQSDASITDIAVSVGFSDSGYFSRVFRREVGMSPEAYRRVQA